MADNDRRTLIEDGTEIEGNIKSSCPVSLNGKVNGQVSAPFLVVTKTGSVNGKVKVDQLSSKGQISGEIDADTVELSGRVNDDTVIRAKTLEVKLENKDGGLQVTFGNCRLAVGDPSSGSDGKEKKSETGERERTHAHVGNRDSRGR